MKKIFNIIWGMMLVFSSCVPEEDLIFEESSANRIASALQEDMNILVGASNGWLMEYYPSGAQAYGGYNILVRFRQDGKVDVAGELTEANSVVTSLFSLKQSAGPVLTFDTYNDIMHFFSDPSDPAGAGGSGYGMEGDFEFTIMSANPQKVVLRGKKSNSVINLTPLDANVNWEDYLTTLQKAGEDMTFMAYECVVNSDTIKTDVSFRNLTFTYIENGVEQSVDAPYIITFTGYKFYDTLNIKGQKVTELSYDATGGMAGWFVSADGVTKLIPTILPLNQQFVKGNWYFAYSGMGPTPQSYWDDVRIGLEGWGEELYYAYLGTYSSYYCIRFASYDGSGLYSGTLNFNYTLVNETDVTLSFASTATGDGAWYYNNAGFNNMIIPLNGRTFTLTTDNIKNPSWIKLQDIAKASNSFILYKNIGAWTFEN
jgi:hypothetical protein